MCGQALERVEQRRVPPRRSVDDVVVELDHVRSRRSSRTPVRTRSARCSSRSERRGSADRRATPDTRPCRPSRRCPRSRSPASQSRFGAARFRRTCAADARDCASGRRRRSTVRERVVAQCSPWPNPRKTRASASDGRRARIALRSHLADVPDPLWLSGRGAGTGAGLQCFVVTPTPSNRADLLLVCSTGGHLLQLVALRDSWQRFTRAWVTFDKSDARSLLAERARPLRARADEPQRQEHAPQPASSRGASSPRCGRRSCSRRAPASPCRSPGSRGCAARRSSTSRASRGSKGPSLTLPADRADRSAPLRAVARARRRAAGRAVRGQRLLGGRMIFVTRRHERSPLRPAAARGRGPADSTRSSSIQHGHSSAVERAERGRSSTSSPFESMVERDPARAGRRHARRRRLGDGLARERQAPGRRPAPEGRSGRRSTTTSCSSAAASPRPGLVTLVEDAGGARRRARGRAAPAPIVPTRRLARSRPAQLSSRTRSRRPPAARTA